MNGFWVDTDFGFDDLWALLLLRHFSVPVAGVSLVAGNTPLPRVVANALGARQAYGFNSPLFIGADRPLVREPETAERILGPRGMLSRGQHLPDVPEVPDVPDMQMEQNLPNALDGLKRWLVSAGKEDQRDILAIGPLTNIAMLVHQAPQLAQKITRLVWMGGSSGPGNHSAQAEFNAIADPEAASLVAQAGLRLDVIDLMMCRKVLFGPSDLPQCDALTADLLGGYLDIGLSRGRAAMAIYDPVAALAAAQPELFRFQHCSMTVSSRFDESYGRTVFQQALGGRTRIGVSTNANAAQICLNALAKDDSHVTV